MNHDVTTLDGLCAIANELCRKHWDVDYTGTITLTTRDWKCKGAHYAPKEIEIGMSKPKNIRMGSEKAIGCLLHELVHWRLHTTERPYHDTDEEFVAECLRVGAPISRTGIAQKVYERFLHKHGLEAIEHDNEEENENHRSSTKGLA